MEENDFLEKKHGFILENRKKAVLTGVKKVESFSDTEVFLYTELGELKIKGKALKIDKVNIETGDLQLSGLVYGMVYGDIAKRVPKNIFTKLIR